MSQLNFFFFDKGKDVFRFNRAVKDPKYSHKSNFLHPVLYFYSRMPDFNETNSIDTSYYLKFADKSHHMLEDFLTFWTDLNNHQVYLRKFFETTLKKDLRNYSKRKCSLLLAVHGSLPPSCKMYLRK